MLRLVRRAKSPNWIIRGSVARSRVEESTGTSDKPAAEEILIKRQAEIQREAVFGRPATATFAEAALSYQLAGGDRRFLAPVIEHFGVTLLARIDQDALDKGARKLYPDAKPSTRGRQFYGPASAVLWHAAKRGWCARPIIERPAASPPRVRWLTYDEAERLIAACSKHFSPLIIFLLYTGARVGEALWLDWKNVDLGRAHVTFPKTKNGEARGVPLHGRVVEALRENAKVAGYVFRRPDGEPYEAPTGDNPDDHSAGTRIKTAFKGACHRAGIDDFHPHDCRHTWATNHYRINRDLGALQRLGGWKSLAMVMRYAHVNVDELAGTIDALPWGKSGEMKIKAQKKKAKSTA